MVWKGQVYYVSNLEAWQLPIFRVLHVQWHNLSNSLLVLQGTSFVIFAMFRKIVGPSSYKDDILPV